VLMEKIEPKMVFVINPDQSTNTTDFLHLELAVMSQLDGQKTVSQIADNLALNPNEVEEIFKKLVSAQILRLVNNSGEDHYLPQDFFKVLSYEMTFLVGPVAGVILEDVLEIMRMGRENFEKRYLPVLIDLLTNQIDDPVKQIEFQRNIYPKIKNYMFK
jgi:hypothetical protein